jgi:hypothetical protein
LEALVCTEFCRQGGPVIVNMPFWDVVVLWLK